MRFNTNIQITIDPYKDSLIREWVDYRISTSRFIPDLALQQDIYKFLSITPEDLLLSVFIYCREIGQPLTIGGEIV
jgi:hypothetical protein